jgi:hypothetical protein
MAAALGSTMANNLDARFCNYLIAIRAHILRANGARFLGCLRQKCFGAF